MEPEGFNGVAGITALSSKGIYYAFTPKMLPVKVNFDDSLVAMLSEASMNLGNLNGIGFLLPNPHVFIMPYLKKEAVWSSRIEGTRTSLSDVFLFEAKEEKDSKEMNFDLQEVINHISATEHALKKIKVQELNLELILELHKILLNGVRGEKKEPGQIRTTQNWIGKPNSSLNDATFVPPEPEKVKALLENLFDYLNAEDNIPPLIKAGIAHYQFESIHPFRDGNGRIGRLIITLYLCKKNVLSLPLLYISGYFEKNRDSYYDLLLDVSKKGNYNSWLKFFLNGVIIQSKDAIERATKIEKYSKECREKLLDRSNTNSLKLFEHLLGNPFITVPNAKKILKKEYPTAQRAIQKLVDAGMLKEITGKQRNTVYVAEKIKQILE
ncbi:MAG: Fic family protein [Candidatus Diapherotrites archaeon]|nr:Fic family protein [Candidatus Diapherotrites archaeon]